MLLYHGTDKQAAEEILRTKVLKGDYPSFGPGVCITIERALNYSVIKTIKHGLKARAMGRIVIFELSDEVLNQSTKDSPEAYTLNKNDIFPLKTIQLLNVRVVTIDQAQKLMKTKNKTQ